jgi:hypothetical protein
MDKEKNLITQKNLKNKKNDADEEKQIKPKLSL